MMQTSQILNHPISSILVKGEDPSFQEGIIKFYLRRPNKRTIIIYGASQSTGKELLELVEDKMSIPFDSLVLFLKGQKIQAKENCLEKTFHLFDSDIVHVHNIESSEKKQINITLKPFQCSIKMEEIKQITVPSDHKIKESLQKNIFLTEQMVFVESGRKLNTDRTFKEELIEDESTIVITTFDRNRIEKSPSTVNNPLQKVQSEIKLTKSKSNQYEDLKKLVQTKPTLRKSMTWSSESCKLNNMNLHQFSFKKKEKPSIYKSMKIQQGKEIIWQSDGSGDLNKNLMKKIPLKKHRRQQSEITQKNKVIEVEIRQEEDHIIFSDEEYNQEMSHEDNENNFSQEDRLSLKNQLNKLLFSDSLQMKQDVTNLQPPQMLDDDFLQQTEQIEMRPDEDEDQEDDEDQDKPQVNTSMNLRQSIGKSRGQFVLPIRMIPTRDFDMGKEDSDSDQQ